MLQDPLHETLEWSIACFLRGGKSGTGAEELEEALCARGNGMTLF